MYIINLYRELKIWYKIRQVAKEYEDTLNKEGFRVDWIGRIYTVINIPDEFAKSSMHPQTYVLTQLTKYNDLFLKMGISDYVSPDISEIQGAYAWLLIISPDRDYFRFFELLKFSLKLILLFVIFKIAYQLIGSEFFVDSFNWLYNIVL